VSKEAAAEAFTWEVGKPDRHVDGGAQGEASNHRGQQTKPRRRDRGVVVKGERRRVGKWKGGQIPRITKGVD
jgi:hypothetical protein